MEDACINSSQEGERNSQAHSYIVPLYLQKPESELQLVVVFLKKNPHEYFKCNLVCYIIDRALFMLRLSLIIKALQSA